MTWKIYINILYINFPPSQGGSTRNLALIDQTVSVELFENGGHIHVYSPGAGADNPPGVNFLNDFVTVFPIQTYR